MIEPCECGGSVQQSSRYGVSSWEAMDLRVVRLANGLWNADPGPPGIAVRQKDVLWTDLSGMRIRLCARACITARNRTSGPHSDASHAGGSTGGEITRQPSHLSTAGSLHPTPDTLSAFDSAYPRMAQSSSQDASGDNTQPSHAPQNAGDLTDFVEDLLLQMVGW